MLEPTESEKCSAELEMSGASSELGVIEVEGTNSRWMRPSRGIQKTGRRKEKQKAAVWAEQGVVQRQECHMPYYRATKFEWQLTPK